MVSLLFWCLMGMLIYLIEEIFILILLMLVLLIFILMLFDIDYYFFDCDNDVFLWWCSFKRGYDGLFKIVGKLFNGSIWY